MQKDNFSRLETQVFIYVSKSLLNLVVTNEVEVLNDVIYHQIWNRQNCNCENYTDARLHCPTICVKLGHWKGDQATRGNEGVTLEDSCQNRVPVERFSERAVELPT